jgi:Txe/YoeB family toxin of toxin-antitoxin system
MTVFPSPPYRLFFTKEALKDVKKLKQAGLQEKTKQLLEILKEDPFQNRPSYEKLVGRLKGTYSRRINIQHRLVYQIHAEERIVRVLRMWTHYE